MIQTTERFKRQIRKWGADLVGVADLTHESVRGTMPDSFKHLTRAISIAIHIKPQKISRMVSKGDKKHERILGFMEENKVAIGRLNKILKHLQTEFKVRRFKYFSLPPITNIDERRFSSSLFHLFPHRMAATCAGLGWIGKNGMLINGEYGPNLMWATILTNAPLTSTESQIVQSNCEGCRLCETVCPTSAVKGVNWSRGVDAEDLVDLKACEDYMDSNVEQFGRPVCGICFMSCPFGIGVGKTAQTG